MISSTLILGVLLVFVNTEVKGQYMDQYYQPPLTGSLGYAYAKSYAWSYTVPSTSYQYTYMIPASAQPPIQTQPPIEVIPNNAGQYPNSQVHGGSGRSTEMRGSHNQHDVGNDGHPTFTTRYSQEQKELPNKYLVTSSHPQRQHYQNVEQQNYPNEEAISKSSDQGLQSPPFTEEKFKQQFDHYSMDQLIMLQSLIAQKLESTHQQNVMANGQNIMAMDTTSDNTMGYSGPSRRMTNIEHKIQQSPQIQDIKKQLLKQQLLIQQLQLERQHRLAIPLTPPQNQLVYQRRPSEMLPSSSPTNGQYLYGNPMETANAKPTFDSSIATALAGSNVHSAVTAATAVGGFISQ